MRIVSLACSNTEIVDALGCASFLVGVDDHTDHPPELVGSLPRVGPDLEIDLDRVEALKPDLVLASLTVPGQETVIEGLEYRNIPFLAPEAESLEEVYGNILEIAAALGVPDRGESLVASMEREMGPGDPEHRPSAVGSPSPADGPRILIQWWPKPVISPGRLSWTHDVLTRAGGMNPLGEQDVKSRPFTDDEVVELAPDAIVLSWCGVDPARYRPDVVRNNPTLAGTPAVRQDRIFCVPEAYLGRPGPRLVEGYRALRGVVERCAGQ